MTVAALASHLVVGWRVRRAVARAPIDIALLAGAVVRETINLQGLFDHATKLTRRNIEP
jgi:hypothetical protein